MKIRSLLCCLLLVSALFAGCKGKGAGESGGAIAVFVPGALSGSAVYTMMADGVLQAMEEWQAGAKAQVIEGGYNQAEWESKLSALAATKKYRLIISSNPSMPAIAQAVLKKFPSQRFLLLDGFLAGNANIYTLRYNQREQGYMAGFMAGLLCAEEGGGRVGLLAAQEYPVMMETLLPAYSEGAKAAHPPVSVDFRVIGNWYDAAKAAGLSSDMISGGAKVILPIAGDANEGAVQAAAQGGAKIIWFDTNGYAVRPGVVAGSSVMYQQKAAYNKTKLFLEDKLPFGTAETVGVADGYVDFIEDDPNYIATVSESVRAKQAAMIQAIKSGALELRAD